MNYFILAQSEVTARALGVWLELLGEAPLQSSDDSGRLTDERIVTQRGPQEYHGGLIPCFRKIAAALTQSVEAHWQDGIVILVDSARPSHFNAGGSPSGWERLLSLLILAFPEVRWVFGGSSDGSSGEWDKLREMHGLASLFLPEFDPLFDGTGLRSYVRGRTAEHNDGSVAPWIPLRTKWAVALDDEVIYAYLHAYITYRNGYRAFAVHTQSLADALLQSAPAGRFPLMSPHLTLEDYYLGFPDKEESVHTSDLKERDTQWEKLIGVKIRHFISGGHRQGSAGTTAEPNRTFRQELRDARRGGREATKPVPGIFALWKALRLDREPKLRHKDAKGKIWKGLAPGFCWPWDDRLVATESETSNGHSAPGLLLLVAEHLIGRAERLADSVIDVRGAVRGAVLATTALELLGPKTPTTAREALELKHRFEVLAECQFGGIQYNLELDERFEEIQRDVKLLGRWYGPRARDAAVLNGELTILSRLIRIFREYEEFDEEEICRRRIRTLHRKIWWKQQNVFNPLAWIVLPIRTYIEFLLGSNTRFAGAIIGWIAGLTLVFNLLVENVTDGDAGGSILGFSQAVSFFFGTESLNGSHPAWVIFTLIAILSGFVHLGVFISQLYSTVARR